MQVFIEFKAYSNEKTNASKPKQLQYVYVSQLKTDYQATKSSLTKVRWIRHYVIEIVLPNNIYLGRKIGIKRTQVLHQMWLRHFTPRQHIPHILITQRKWRPDPEVISKHEDLCARARECENGKSILIAITKGR